MSNRHSRHEAEARTIHPHVLAQVGTDACVVALGVARDLRSGVIPPEKFDMRWLRMRQSCGSSCCIAGWMLIRGIDNATLAEFNGGDLFAPWHPSDPILAADAVERYIYDGSLTPWIEAEDAKVL